MSNTFLGILSLADLDDFGATYMAPTTLAQAVALAWDRPSQWFYPGLIVFEHMLATNALVLAAAHTGQGLTIQAETPVNADIAESRLVCIKRIHCKKHGYYLVRPQTAGSAKLTTFIGRLKRSL